MFSCLSVINPPKSEVRCGSSAWRALIANVRLLILSAFDRLFLKYEDNIRNYREQRNDPSWSFCKYFLYQVIIHFYLQFDSFFFNEYLIFIGRISFCS